MTQQLVTVSEGGVARYGVFI